MQLALTALTNHIMTFSANQVGVFYHALAIQTLEIPSQFPLIA